MSFLIHETKSEFRYAYPKKNCKKEKIYHRLAHTKSLVVQSLYCTITKFSTINFTNFCQNKLAVDVLLTVWEIYIRKKVTKSAHYSNRKFKKKHFIKRKELKNAQKIEEMKKINIS